MAQLTLKELLVGQVSKIQVIALLKEIQWDITDEQADEIAEEVINLSWFHTDLNIWFGSVQKIQIVRVPVLPEFSLS